MVASTPTVRSEPWYIRLELPLILPGVLLSAVLVWSVAQSLIIANWATGVEIIMSLAIPALVLGVIFARLAWLPGWLAHLLAGALGIAWTVQRVGPLLIDQVSEEFGSTLASRLNTWGDQASEIVIRTLIWLRILQAGGRGEDVLLFVVTLALLMWVLGYSTGWLLFRSGRVWLAVVFNAVVILINYTFILPKPTVLFFIFLGTALLLLVYQHVAQQQQTWRAALIEFPSMMLWRAVAAAAIFCGLLIVATSTIPGAVTSAEAQRAWRVLRSPFTSLREGWQDAFSTINAPPGTSGSFATRGVRVGGPRALGDAVVMRVRSRQFDYWRAVSFDRYSGRNWQNTVGERARAILGMPTAEQARTFVDPGMALAQTELRGRTLVTQTVELVQARTDGLLTVGGQFSSAGVPTLVQHGFVVDQNNQPLPNYTELATVVAEVPLEETQTYTVSAYISTVDERSLREAGTAYPEWVRASYLQIPETLPERVRVRAAELVQRAGADNPYDIALAIQSNLRTLPYDERREAPPEDRDWVDYFLFEGQRGYCDDFASAMVVMLRSQGVPSRWVQGYAGGALDPDRGDYVVRESVAHSWVEAYFPGYGWQRFEPTPAPYANVPARPAAPPADDDDDDATPSGDVSNELSDPDAIMRRLMEQNEYDDGSGDPEALRRLIEQIEAERRRQQLLIGLSVGGVLTLGALLFLLSLRLELRGLSPVAAVYARLARLGSWAGLPQQPHVTPSEYANELRQVVPEERDPIDRIVDAYNGERYRPDHQPGDLVKDNEWGSLRWALIGRMFSRLFSVRRTPER